MSKCEVCGIKEADLGCLFCARNVCSDCYQIHMERLTGDMDEGYPGTLLDERPSDSRVVCEVCGAPLESEKKDEHLFEVHGIVM